MLDLGPRITEFTRLDIRRLAVADSIKSIQLTSSALESSFKQINSEGSLNYQLWIPLKLSVPLCYS